MMIQRGTKLRRIPRGAAGFALLEGLIGILIFSIAVLGIVGVQTAMAKNAALARFRAEATFLANDLIGTIWTDQGNMSRYAMTDAGGCVIAYAPCTGWRANVAGLLPGGNANVTINGDSVQVVVIWQQPGEAPSRVQIDATISD